MEASKKGAVHPKADQDARPSWCPYCGGQEDALRASLGKDRLHQECIFDGVGLVGLNRYIRQHWATRRKEKEEWAERFLRLAPVTAPIDIHVERIYGGRGKAMDPDNLVGGVKPLLDGMVKAKIIPDDNPDQIRLYVSQVKGDSNAVRVTVVGTPEAE